jgi:hypothetical protein
MHGRWETFIADRKWWISFMHSLPKGEVHPIAAAINISLPQLAAHGSEKLIHYFLPAALKGTCPPLVKREQHLFLYFIFLL